MHGSLKDSFESDKDTQKVEMSVMMVMIVVTTMKCITFYKDISHKSIIQEECGRQ
jgi:hypothetical protein